jgi:hypothetical protein
LQILSNFRDWVEREGNLGPVLSIAACIVAFGLFIPVLGFYWDDWPTIFYTFNDRTAQLINHFSYDRPFSVWAYWLVGRLGTAPVTWHVAALALRLACVAMLAWALKPLWPRQARLISLIALVFAIYPGYYLQPSSVIFLPHIASLALFLFSLGAMGRAAREPERYWQYTIVGVLAALAQVFTVEYYAGLELLRPLYLWLLFANAGDGRPRLAALAKQYAPYFLVFVAWVAWRMFLLELPVEPYPVVFATELRTAPLSALFNMTQTALTDLVYTFALTWAQLVAPLWQIASSVDLAITLATLAIAAGLFAVLRHQLQPTDPRVAKQGLLLGAAAFILGMFPIWAIGETIAQGDYNLRYILVGMAGAAIFVVSLLALLRRPQWLAAAISILAALAIGSHLRTTEEFRGYWQEQRAFIWQLAWRAPGFQPSTALVSFAPAAAQLRDPMTGNALNVAYPTAGQPPSIGLWNFELSRTATVEALEAGEDLTNDYRGLTFTTGSADDLVFYFLPENGCLWMLSPLDVHNEYLPAEHRQLVARSNLANVLPASTPGFPPQHVFGAEPQRGWCYYFEKASLAAQQGDWASVYSLTAEADSLGLSPNNGIEWLPLLSAHLATGDFAAALALTERVHTFDPKADSMLCAHWQAYPGEQYAQAAAIANCDSQ